jgi:hypothetical protein
MPLAALNNQVVFKKLLSDEEILKAFIKDFLESTFNPKQHAQGFERLDEVIAFPDWVKYKNNI